MSGFSPTPSFEPGPLRPWWKDSSGLTEYLREVSLFLAQFRRKLRIGEHSRLPLHLVRLNLSDGAVFCDWVARDPDPWDSVLPPGVGMRHASLQALKDAIEARALLFRSIRAVDYAYVRAYRRGPGNQLEPVLAGSLRRNSGTFRSTHSLIMRAKLLGFRFRLEDDVLLPLSLDDDI